MKSILACAMCFWSLATCQKLDDTVQRDAALNQSAAKPTTAARSGINGIVGANWADERDNFTTDRLILSGLTQADNYATVRSTATKVLSGFQNLGINTVRLPLNPPTVLEIGWTAYQGAIDEALGKNMKVILAVWEASDSRNGQIDDLTKFWNLWQVVVSKYGANPNVYFEPFNEPHGYSVPDLKNIYADWLGRYSTVPRGRVVLGGAGYCTDVNSIGSDAQFNGCLLGYHNYGFFNAGIQTVNGWDVKFGQDLNYPSRTIITEFGGPMTNGKNYTGPATDGEIAFLQSITDVMNNRGIAGVYWPGLRTNDFYALTTFDGNGLTVTNASGLARLNYGWSLNDSPGGPIPSFDAGAYYRLVNRSSGKVLDVNQGSLADGAAIIQQPSNGGNSQQWRLTSAGNGTFTIMNRNSSKLFDVPGVSLTEGTSIIQYYPNNGANQQWRITDVGGGYYRIVSRSSGLTLEISGYSTADGTSLTQWFPNGGGNQQWQIVRL